MTKLVEQPDDWTEPGAYRVVHGLAGPGGFTTCRPNTNCRLSRDRRTPGRPLLLGRVGARRRRYRAPPRHRQSDVAHMGVVHATKLK